FRRIRRLSSIIIWHDFRTELGGTAINVNSLTLVNYASGVVTGDAFAISGSQTPFATITNFVTISTIAGDFGVAIQFNHANIVNNVGGIISGDFTAIQTSTGTTVFNAGTITGVNGPAIQFGGTGNTLTIAPTSVINGNVIAGGTDTFQLSGPGTGTFDLGLIGTQYTGFTTYNKVDASTWTLTGTGNQAWTVMAGTLLVNGDLSGASGIVVSPGGTLGGIGILPTTHVNGGVFAPGHAGKTSPGHTSFAAEPANLPPDIALAYNAVLKAPPRSFDQRWSVRGAAYGGYNRTDGDPSGLGTVGAHRRPCGCARLPCDPRHRGGRGGGRRRNQLEPRQRARRRAQRRVPSRHLRRDPPGAGLSEGIAGLHLASGQHRSPRPRRRPADGAVQCAELRRPTRSGLRLGLAARRGDALCGRAGAKLPYAVLQRDRYGRRWVRARLCGAHRDRYAQRARRPLRACRRALPDRGSGAAHAARLGS
ncbi:MAG TPA: hypothetical protein VGI22_25470, partial [Xanthobacteraceae bacterium]